MKRLTIIYGDFTVFDSDVSECEIKDGAAGITVVGKLNPAARRQNGGNLSGLLNGLAAAAKKQQELAEAPKDDVAPEPEDAPC